MQKNLTPCPAVVQKSLSTGNVSLKKMVMPRSKSSSVLAKTKEKQMTKIRSSKPKRVSQANKNQAVPVSEEIVDNPSDVSRENIQNVLEILRETDRALTERLAVESKIIKPNTGHKTSMMNGSVITLSTERVERKPDLASKPLRRISIKKRIDLNSLEVGDMVAIGVSIDHFIPGQPSIGKLITLPDDNGYAVVHYYTGSYDGTWWPMTSRQSPYTRQVKVDEIYYKFHLDADGKMTDKDVKFIRSKTN